MIDAVGDEPVWSRGLLASPHAAPDKASRVRRMFNSIAPRYELVNSLFSAGRDAYWRRKAVELAKVQGDDEVLDLACGTGDFARAFGRAGPRRVVGCDFAHEMLIRAERSSRQATEATSRRLGWVEADAKELPFEDASFSVASCAFGVRNFADLESGLREMHRVLRSGGRVVILEFMRPANPVVRRFYEVFSNRIMPIAATWVSGDTSGAYRYFPRSVVTFLDTEQMCAKLQAVGFTQVTSQPLTLGVVRVFMGVRS